ncbi:MAG: hypothetical protein WC442_02525 [Candidatus Omnitrophota bacterium]
MRTNKLRLLIVMLAVASCYRLAWAKSLEERLPQDESLQPQPKEVVPDIISSRVIPEYKSGGLRDPFQTYIIKERKGPSTYDMPQTDLSKSKVDFSELKVQGIIWGVKTPQAIINNRIYNLGDKIEDAEIIGIDNKGVSLSSVIGIVNLPPPGQGGNSSDEGVNPQNQQTL